MREEICTVVQNFITYHKIKDVKPSDEMVGFLKKEANRLTILRAVGNIDYYSAECISPIYPEVPTRTIKQFVKLYRCLKSLDDDYPDEKVKEIITHIVDSSGNKVRQLVLNILEKNPATQYKISDIQQLIGLGRKPAKIQLEILWNLRVVEKEVRVEPIGGYGRIEEVAYYSYKPSFTQILLDEKKGHIK